MFPDDLVVVGAGKLLAAQSVAAITAGSGPGVVVVAPHAGELARLLARHGLAVERAGDQAHGPRDTTAAVSQIAFDHRLRIVELTETSQSLEGSLLELRAPTAQFATALCPARDRHAAAEEGQASEHALLGGIGVVGEQLTDAVAVLMDLLQGPTRGPDVHGDPSHEGAGSRGWRRVRCRADAQNRSREATSAGRASLRHHTPHARRHRCFLRSAGTPRGRPGREMASGPRIAGTPDSRVLNPTGLSAQL